MRVLFLLKNTGMQERMGVMTLSSILKTNGHSVSLLLTENMTKDECITEVRRSNPELLAYSLMTGEHNYYLRLNEEIREEFNCFSVFGGPHPTFHPEIVEARYVDAICRGEGDIYFAQLLERMEKGDAIYDIPNFWFKKPDGEIIKNAPGLLVEKLDDLPFPDREIIYNADPALRTKGIKMFMSMRGCPYLCTYCFNHVYNEMFKDHGELLRYRSVDNILAEIKSVKGKYFLDRVSIGDDTFLLKPKGWLEEFAEKFPREIGLPLICNVRANLITSEVGHLLRQMNCLSVWMGVECGNNEIATNVLKRHISNEQIVKACKILHANNIRVWTQNLTGLPVENSLEVDLQTLDFNIQLKPEFAFSSIFYPYPGTELAQLAVESGMFDANFEKVGVSNKTASALDFGENKIKLQTMNLHKLFGIIVQWPFLRRYAMSLISLPLTALYTWLFFAFYGFKVLTLSSAKGNMKSIGHYVLFYFRYVARLENKAVFKSTT